LNDAAASFPEVVADLAACAGDFIVDGEIIAQRDNEPLPFRYLQPRLQRKDPSPELLAEIPATFIAFDLLASQGRFLLDEPLVERRSLLAAALSAGAHLQVAPWSTLEVGAAGTLVEERFEQARARGNEGLMLKRTDSPYSPGRRGRWWHKLKRELSTLDVVVVGVQWGHGKRHTVLSDYTFAVRRSAASDELVTIGKAYSGLTDAEIATMTEWFLNHRTGELGRHVYAVAPEVVIEVAFDIIQKSDLHAGGYSLRFPRIVRLRPDKPAHEADTLADVERIYREMLEREGVAR
jgi:DNA ligase 1